MRVGTLVSLPDAYTQYARIRDDSGVAYTVDPGEIPKGAKVDDNFAYRLDLFNNGGGLGYSLIED